jgi:tRNA-2-methylthio-N6-dimethylallyladenosine synthase
LQALLESQRAAFAESFAGRETEVLFEKPGRHAGQIVGRTPYLHSVQVLGPAHLIGTTHRVAIERPGSYSLFGHLVGNDTLREAAI